MDKLTGYTHTCPIIGCPQCGQPILDACYCFQLDNAICSACLEVPKTKLEPIDNFQPMQVIRFLKDARTAIHQIDTEERVWSEDMKKGALLALAWVHAEVLQMAANRHKGE